MRLEYFQLKQHPFMLHPDPKVVFYSSQHARAKSLLSYACWKWDGYTVITGELGTGKTLLTQQLLLRLGDGVSCIHLQHAHLNETEFLQLFLAYLGGNAFDADKAELLALTHRTLLEAAQQQRRCLLLIDDAHHLSPAVLETIRHLSSLGSGKYPLLNVVLVGDTRLTELLNREDLVQFRQRVRFSYYLAPLSQASTVEYINFRVFAVGGFGQLFSDRAMTLIYQASRGVPRLINMLCEVGLVAAYVQGVRQVDSVQIETALTELGWFANGPPGSTIPVKQLLDVENSTALTPDLAGNRSPSITIHRNGTLLDEFMLDLEKITLGKAPENDTRLHDPLACDHHAVIHRRADNHYVIEDLDSVSGTYVNGNAVTAHTLNDGDEFSIASYEFSFNTPPAGSETAVIENLTVVPSSEDEIFTQISWENIEQA